MADGPDDLLRRAEEIKKMSAAAGKAARQKYKKSSFGRAQQQVTELQETVMHTAGTLNWLYARVVRPVASHPRVRVPGQLYMKLWNHWVYRKDGDGDSIFSNRRAGMMVLATLAFLWMLPGILAGIFELMWDTGRMTTSYRSGEIWYLGKSQEIDPAENIFAVQGCKSVRCSDQTSVYFRIKPSLAHQIWSIYNNNNFFFPDYVAAGVQNDINKCEVTGYGLRWKFLVRNWDMYPQILSVDCVPLSDDEIKNSVNRD